MLVPPLGFPMAHGDVASSLPPPAASWLGAGTSPPRPGLFMPSTAGLKSADSPNRDVTLHVIVPDRGARSAALDLSKRTLSAGMPSLPATAPAPALSPTDLVVAETSPLGAHTASRERRASASDDGSTSPPPRGDPMMKKIINCQLLDF
jgi:hypothetical protein